MDLIKTYTSIVYDLADHRTRDWPFLGSYMPILMIQLGYLYIVNKGGPIFMHNRKPFDLKRVIQIYNIIQIISCTYIIHVITNNISMHDILTCTFPDTSNNYHAMELARICWWLMLLKMFELIETVFFVLRKKYNQVSVLHVHHHVITLFFVWILANHYPGGGALFPVYINTIIHFIMYTYYLLSTFGPKWQNALAKWKNKLTMLQMIQFTIILIHASQIFFLDKCKNVPKIIEVIFFPNLILIFKNFYDFYQANYVKKTD